MEGIESYKLKVISAQSPPWSDMLRQPDKPIGCYMPGLTYYDYKPGLGQGELKLRRRSFY